MISSPWTKSGRTFQIFLAFIFLCFKSPNLRTHRKTVTTLVSLTEILRAAVRQGATIFTPPVTMEQKSFPKENAEKDQDPILSQCEYESFQLSFPSWKHDAAIKPSLWMCWGAAPSTAVLLRHSGSQFREIWSGLECGHPDDVGLRVVGGAGGVATLWCGSGRCGHADHGGGEIGLVAVQRKGLLKFGI